jgi:hypothetical protein
MGIGDAITVLYAACGLAAAGYKVTYNARHYKWIQWASHPALTLRPLTANESLGGVDVNQEYMDQLWESFIGRLESRPHWALRAIRKQYPSVPETVEPCRPELVIKPDPVEHGEYIVLSPYSSVVGPSRNWPAASYARVIHGLKEAGYRCFVPITSERKEDAWIFESAGAKVWVDAKPEDVCSLIANARLLIGNDSGMPHLGGLFQVPTFAIMAHVTPAVTFRCSDTVQGIVPHPRVSCRFCCWQKEGGHIKACLASCAALGSILPEDVLTDVLFQLGKKGSMTQSIRS